MVLPSRRIRVLYVDDDSVAAERVSTALRREDDRFDVVTAAGPQAGLDALSGTDIDCVVSDYGVPSEAGIEFLERVRSEYAALPLILYTAAGCEDVASAAISAGVTEYLQWEPGARRFAVLTDRIRTAVDRRRAEGAANAAPDRLARDAEETDDVVYVADGDWSELLFANSACEERWGGSGSTLPEDPEAFLDCLHPDDRARAERSMERLSNGESSETVYRVGSDDEVRWVRCRSEPVLGDGGSVSRIVGFARDVTDQRNRETRLKSRTARLEALFEYSPDLIVVHDSEGTIRDVNRRLCDELGYTKAGLVGTTVWELDETADPEVARSFWEELPPDSARKFEGRLQRRDGSTLPVEINLVRLDLDGEDRFVAIDRDITERKAREEELERQNERLDEFASVVSHDLRNPLQLARGRLELAREECDSEHLAHVDSALDRMEELTDDLLALARMGEEAVDAEPVSLASVAAECWRIVRSEDATLVTETDVEIRADAGQLRQLLENLFGNAIEHAGEDATVTLGRLDDGFYVADDGPGIPNADRTDVFEAGYSTSRDGFRTEHRPSDRRTPRLGQRRDGRPGWRRPHRDQGRRSGLRPLARHPSGATRGAGPNSGGARIGPPSLVRCATR